MCCHDGPFLGNLHPGSSPLDRMLTTLPEIEVWMHISSSAQSSGVIRFSPKRESSKNEHSECALMARTAYGRMYAPVVGSHSAATWKRLLFVPEGERIVFTASCCSSPSTHCSLV